jgi:hypothetical protein
MYSGNVIRCLGFSRRGVFIGEGAASEVVLVGLTIGGSGPALGRAPWWRGPPVAPLRLLFGSLEASVNFWTSGFCFIQFREYFLCNFSETKKIAENRELALWHLVNRLVLENA